GAARRMEVHLLVVGVSGGPLTPTPLVRSLCTRVVAEPARTTAPAAGETPAQRLVRELTDRRPGPCRLATAETLGRCQAALQGETYAAVHVARLYMVPFAVPFLEPPGARPRATLDLDDVESRAWQRLGDLCQARGELPAAVLHRAEATRYAAMERRLL